MDTFNVPILYIYVQAMHVNRTLRNYSLSCAWCAIKLLIIIIIIENLVLINTSMRRIETDCISEVSSK